MPEPSPVGDSSVRDPFGYELRRLARSHKVRVPLGSAVAVRRLAATRRGMKSCTSPTPSGIRKRVIRTAVSGR